MGPLQILISVTRLKPASAFLCTILIIFFFASVTQAQSGRAPKAKGTPAPSATSENTTKPGEAKARLPILSLVIVNSVNSAKAVVWTSMALKELIDRIRESPDMKVTQEKDMSRKEAGELAQTKTDVYVVWIQFEVDASMGAIDRETDTVVMGLNPGCLFISYIVFMPGTTKIKAQQRIYQDGYRAQCIGTATQPATQSSDRLRYPVTQTLPKAAREAADRIKKALELPSSIASS